MPIILDISDGKCKNIGSCQSLWFNKKIRCKSKQYFYYDDWYGKNVYTISDLLNPPLPGFKLFEELILDFDISNKDRRKYNFLIKNIPNFWLENRNKEEMNVVDDIIINLVQTKKVPRYAYKILYGSCTPDNRYEYWNDKVSVPHDVNWETIHSVNFKCTIDTRLRSLYFKIFHNAIALNNFLFKIKRKDTPNCSFCDKKPETMVHLFCNCDIVIPMWQDLLLIIRSKYKSDVVLNDFKKMFGVPSDTFLSFLFLSLKSYIHTCKFRNITPTSAAFKIYMRTQKETEYYIAKKRGKLQFHFKKWSFDF